MINQHIFIFVALFLIVTECRVCQCHLSAAIAGDPRHVGAKITRVSRGPALNMASDDLVGGGGGDFSDDLPTFIKSPAYQLKHKPGKPSKFNGDSPFQSYGTPSFSSYAPLAPSRSNWADVPSITFTNQPGGIDEASSSSPSTATNYYPTFTPHIGPRALSNLDEFFEHLRENVHAIQQDQNEPAVYYSPEKLSSSSGDNLGSSQNDDEPSDGYDYYAHLLRFSPPQYEQVVVGSGIDDEDDNGDFANQGNRHEVQQFHDMRPGFRWMPPASGAIGRGQLYKMKAHRAST